jgi:drug/metabolite transporter (DMT)-like permease
MYLYYKGIHKEDPSTIALTIQMMPIFTLLFAALILQETLTSHQLAAFILIFSGGLTIGLKQGAKISFSKAVLMVLGSAVIWGFGDVIFKLTEPSVPNYGMALSLFFSGAIITMSMVLLFNKKAQAELKRASKKSLGTLMGMQLFDTLGEVAFFYALTIGKASLTAVISLVQPLSAFIFGTILAYFIPHLKTEDLSPFSLAKKGTAFLLILYGLTLL